jgi:hypothetical protein
MMLMYKVVKFVHVLNHQAQKVLLLLIPLRLRLVHQLFVYSNVQPHSQQIRLVSLLRQLVHQLVTLHVQVVYQPVVYSHVPQHPQQNQQLPHKEPVHQPQQLKALLFLDDRLQVQALLVPLQLQLADQPVVYSNVPQHPQQNQQPRRKEVIHQHQQLEVLLLLLDRLVNLQAPNINSILFFHNKFISFINKFLEAF